MNIKSLTLLLYISFCSVIHSTEKEIQYKSTKEDFLKQLTAIWKSAEVSIQPEELEFNSIKKDYLIITVTSKDDISEEEFSRLVRSTSSLIFKGITNTGDFKGARADFLNTTSNTEKSKIVFEIIDKAPILKGCKKNATNKALKKCFNEKLMSHIQKNFDPSVFNNIGLEKKQHKAITNFAISEKGTVINIVVEHEISVVRNEIEQLMKSLKVKKPGFNNGKPVKIQYTFPIVFVIE
jgi:hypothetical protein